MKFKANDASTRNSKASAQAAGQAASQAPSPSVPISVYRQLAAELQATQAMVDSLNAKNQDLTLQNQTLRQEIHRFAQSAIALKSLVEPNQLAVGAPKLTQQTATRTNPSHPSHPEAAPQPSLEETATAAAIAARLRPIDPASPREELFTEAQALPNLPQEKRPRNLGGLWLTLTIVLIMVTAFGAGFLVVRPLLPTSGK